MEPFPFPKYPNGLSLVKMLSETRFAAESNGPKTTMHGIYLVSDGYVLETVINTERAHVQFRMRSNEQINIFGNGTVHVFITR